MKNMKKHIVKILSLLIMGTMLFSMLVIPANAGNYFDKYEKYFAAEDQSPCIEEGSQADKMIKRFQNATLKGYPDITVGECLDNSFKETRWSTAFDKDCVVMFGGANYDGKPAEFAIYLKEASDGTVSIYRIKITYEKTGKTEELSARAIKDLVKTVFTTEQTRAVKIRAVRNAAFVNHPDVPVGEGIDEFFHETYWDYDPTDDTVIALGSAFYNDEAVVFFWSFQMKEDQVEALNFICAVYEDGSVLEFTTKEIAWLIDLVFSDYVPYSAL